MQIAVLHPGEMGSTIAASLLASGHRVLWVSAGRSAASRSRAAGLIECPSLADALARADGVISVCPPAAAEGLAQAVRELGFSGIYVDANAIAPGTARRIAAAIGPNFVDGGIIGPPAVQPDTTRLYLSGAQAPAVRAWFSDGPLAAIALPGNELVAASGLKMAYAAQTKGANAMLLAVNALAVRLGVQDALAEEWALSQPQLAARSEAAARNTSRKAWRFEGEMREIAATFAESGLPAGFHEAAAQVYQRMGALKDLPPQHLEAVIEALLRADRPD